MLFATNAFAAGHKKIASRVAAIRDRIVMTEPLSEEQMDRIGWRNRQGVYDTRTVFADGLNFATSVLPWRDGVLVTAAPHLWFMRDTDGDGRGDERLVLLSGFGTEDTHHLLHTFRYGADGLLYFNQSIYIHSHIETPYGVKRLAGGGIWRFRPETARSCCTRSGQARSVRSSASSHSGIRTRSATGQSRVTTQPGT